MERRATGVGEVVRVGSRVPMTALPLVWAPSLRSRTLGCCCCSGASRLSRSCFPAPPSSRTAPGFSLPRSSAAALLLHHHPPPSASAAVPRPLFLVLTLLFSVFSSSSSRPLRCTTLAVAVMAAAASMASLTSTSCLPQRVSASRAQHQISPTLGLGYRASAGLSNCPRLVNSTFSGIQLQLRTQASVRKQNFGVPIRAAGAKGDYLVQKVSARELDDILANERSSPMVVDFYATWCGPCILLAQELEQLAVEYGDRVRFLKIDTDEEHELANQMEIRGLPTMVFVSPDTEKLAIRTEGLLSTNVIRDIIEKEL